MQAEPCPPAAEVRYLKEPLQVQSLEGEAPGYAKRLATTAFGLPSLGKWCLWIEPVPDPADRWSVRWRRAVDSALSRWRDQVPVALVNQPERAQIRILRKRPPRRRTDTGWRASNGRSVLRLAELNRAGQLRREPHVELLISPELRAEALEATALHELGHAFGLWGHSDDSRDALAVHQGAVPVLAPSDRDRQTLTWVRSQQNRFGPITGPINNR